VRREVNQKRKKGLKNTAVIADVKGGSNLNEK